MHVSRKCPISAHGIQRTSRLVLLFDFRVESGGEVDLAPIAPCTFCVRFRFDFSQLGEVKVRQIFVYIEVSNPFILQITLFILEDKLADQGTLKSNQYLWRLREVVFGFSWNYVGMFNDRP